MLRSRNPPGIGDIEGYSEATVEKGHHHYNATLEGGRDADGDADMYSDPDVGHGDTPPRHQGKTAGSSSDDNSQHRMVGILNRKEKKAARARLQVQITKAIAK